MTSAELRGLVQAINGRLDNIETKVDLILRYSTMKLRAEIAQIKNITDQEDYTLHMRELLVQMEDVLYPARSFPLHTGQPTTEGCDDPECPACALAA